MIRKNLFVFIIFILTIHLSCKKSFEGSDEISEGIIEYNISYPTIPKDDLLLELLPSKMKMSFKNHSFRSDIVAGMGLFRTSIISSKDEDKLVHTVKMLNTRYASTLAISDLNSLNPVFSNITIEFTKNVKEIAGFICKEAIVKVQSDSTWSCNVFYTTEINIENPNRNTPFEEIKGVLMEYQLINYDTHMYFTAEKVYPKEIENDIVELEEGYKMVTPTALGNEIKSIFAKIK